MGGAVSANEFVRWYQKFSSLLRAVGHTVNDSELLARVAPEEGERYALDRILQDYRRDRLNGEAVPGRVCENMRELCEGLADHLRADTKRLTGGELPGKAEPEELAGHLRRLPGEQRDGLADILVADGYRHVIEHRYVSVEQFQELLEEFAGDQTVARRKLISHLRAEFKRRGIDMSCDTIEERFRADPVVRTIPYCVKQIFKELGDEFRTGLVPIKQLIGQEDPDKWLRKAQRRLKFRSQSAMHKAIARATEVSYDSIHKALSGKKKAKHIQVQVKECLQRWLAKARRGEELDVDDGYRGLPVQQMCELMPTLLKRFDTKEAIYRAISEQTDVRAGSIRRYFQNDGRLKYAPLAVYRVAREMAEVAPSGEPSQSAAPPADKSTAEVSRLAGKAQDALERWHRHKGDPEREREFKDLRRSLIATLRKRRIGTVADFVGG